MRASRPMVDGSPMSRMSPADRRFRFAASPARHAVLSCRAGEAISRSGATTAVSCSSPPRKGRSTVCPCGPDAKDGLAFGPITRLKVPPLGERHWGTVYEVSSDGRRFYFPDPGDARPPREFGVVMNWSALLK